MLLEQLAQRPDTVCPFLGLEKERAGYREGADAGHRCYAFGDPAVLSDEQQTRVCLQRGYGNCPRYLRGVLVIPTEELEALRRPAPPRAEPAAPPPPRRRRRGGAWIGALVLLLLLVIGVGGAAYLLLGGGLAAIGLASPSSEPSGSVAATAEPSPLATATLAVTPAPTASDASPTPLPTADVEDVFAYYEVGVGPAEYRLYQLAGPAVADEFITGFSDFSHARVAPLQLDDGRVAWVTQDGALAGVAYIAPTSGDFEIRAVFTAPDGALHAIVFDDAERELFPTSTPAP